MSGDASEHLGESQLVASLLRVQRVQQSRRLLSVRALDLSLSQERSVPAKQKHAHSLEYNQPDFQAKDSEECRDCARRRHLSMK